MQAIGLARFSETGNFRCVSQYLAFLEEFHFEYPVAKSHQGYSEQ
jgi:hypothetical protein